jgi:ABC-type branched-subunit amino acid transport system ATPase component
MTLLNVHNLTYHFPDYRILDNISLTVRTGEAVGITCSDNAAGSTLLECISGTVTIAAGSIFLHRRPVQLFSPEKRAELGIRRVPEIKRLCPLMTTAEILETGGFTTRTCRRIAEMLDRVFTLLPSLIRIRRTQFINLTPDEQYLISIGFSLMADPQLLLLDAPPIKGHSLLWPELSLAIDTARKRGTAILTVVPSAEDHTIHTDRLYAMQHGRTIPYNPSDGRTGYREAAPAPTCAQAA